MPTITGVVAGAAITGAFSSLGPLSMTLTGYAGVLLANFSAAYLDGWRRGLFLPVALAAGVVMTALCLVQLVAGGRWWQLSLLLLLTAIPTALVAVRRPETRPVALPTAIGCLAGSVLLALPDRLLDEVSAATLLTVFYGVAMAVGSGLDAASRRATSRAAAASAAAAVLLLVAARRGATRWRWSSLSRAVHPRLGLADRARPRPGGRGRGLRAPPGGLGAAQLVLAAWVGAASGRSGRRRVVLAARGRRAADRGRARGCARAPPGRRGGRACWWPPCRRQCWP